MEELAEDPVADLEPGDARPDGLDDPGPVHPVDKREVVGSALRHGSVGDLPESTGFMLAAPRWTRISPGPGVGFGRSISFGGGLEGPDRECAHGPWHRPPRP